MSAKLCPMMGECVQERCRWWIHVTGQHPQTGAIVDSHGCAVEFLPVLIIEGAAASRQTVAAVSQVKEVFVQAARSQALGEPTDEYLQLTGLRHASRQ